MIATLHRVVYWLWIGTIVFLAIYLIVFPSTLSAENLEYFLSKFGTSLLVSYIAVSFIRGFLMIPSSPFVLAGGILLPQSPMLIIIISLAGIMFSATLIYYFSDSIGLNEALQKKYPKLINPVMEKLSKPKAIWLVIFWSMFPLVPTDLICYIAGVVKMPFSRMMLGLFIGELPLVMAYVYLGKSILTWIG
ncbi:MAG: VTT domain-containing protein [Bacteroidota bacterium]